MIFDTRDMSVPHSSKYYATVTEDIDIAAITVAQGGKLSACRRLYIGTAGDLVVRHKEASADVTYTNVSGLLEGSFSYIRLTGTTAAKIVIEW
jgi:hypothetical protein